MPTYEVRSLTKVYGHAVVANDDLTFDVDRGEIFGILGPNGAGKSTLVQQMAGISAPTRGTIRMLGRTIRPHDLLVRRAIGFLSQRPLALFDLKAREAVAYTGMLRGLSGREASRQADELLRRLGVDDRAQRLVGTLSGGEHRLIGLAAALIAQPPILILDEPTNELDPVVRARVWDTVLQRRERGTTVILVTHNVLEAERVVSRVAIMARGRLAAVGTPGELKLRLHQRVRIAIALRDGIVPTALQSLGATRRIGELRWELEVERGRLGEVLQALAQREEIRRLDDLRVTTPSLEDVYVAVHAEGGDVDGSAG